MSTLRTYGVHVRRISIQLTLPQSSNVVADCAGPVVCDRAASTFHYSQHTCQLEVELCCGRKIELRWIAITHGGQFVTHVQGISPSWPFPPSSLFRNTTWLFPDRRSIGVVGKSVHSSVLKCLRGQCDQPNELPQIWMTLKLVGLTSTSCCDKNHRAFR